MLLAYHFPIIYFVVFVVVVLDPSCLLRQRRTKQIFVQSKNRENQCSENGNQIELFLYMVSIAAQ